MTFIHVLSLHSYGVLDDLTLSTNSFQFFFFLNDPAPPEIYPLPLPPAFPIPHPSRRATAAAVEDFPEAAGPSMAMTRRVTPPPRPSGSPLGFPLPRFV